VGLSQLKITERQKKEDAAMERAKRLSVSKHEPLPKVSREVSPLR